MRTLHFIESEDKRRRIARETMDIYAPLVERIGMQRFKDELENLAFQTLNPDAYNSILTRLEFLKREGEDLPNRIVDELRRQLANGGIEAWVSGRVKTP
jgi:GTP pyrophosphokinase